MSWHLVRAETGHPKEAMPPDSRARVRDIWWHAQVDKSFASLALLPPHLPDLGSMGWGVDHACAKRARGCPSHQWLDRVPTHT